MSRAGRKNRFSFAKNRKRLGRGLRLAHNRDPTTPSLGTARRAQLAPPGGRRCARTAGRWSGQGLPGRAASTLSQSEVEKSCARVDFSRTQCETPTGSVDFSTTKRRSVPGRGSGGSVSGRRVCPGGRKKTGFFSFFPAGLRACIRKRRALFRKKNR